MKKTIIVEFLSLFESKETPQNQIAIAMQMLILPMLDHAFQNGQNWDIIDSSILKTIVENLPEPDKKVSSLTYLFLKLQLCLAISFSHDC